MIDAHLHLWDPARLDYDWLRHVPSIAGRRDPDAWATLNTGVRRAVFVQADCAPDQALAEVDWIAGLSHPTLEILGAVAFAPLELGEAVGDHLDALLHRPFVRGVRRSLQNETGAFIIAPRHLDGLVAAAERGLTIDICARDHHLSLVIQVLDAVFDRAPDARVVLDHLGKPDIAAHAGDILGADWALNLRRLATYPNVFAKLSGLTTQDHWTEGCDETLVPYIRHALKCFGPERLMFGGDWPVVDLAGGYARWLKLFEATTAALPPRDRLRIAAGTATEFYALAPETLA
jgi:L-fuconolactonase